MPDIESFQDNLELQFYELQRMENSIGEQQFAIYHDGNKLRISPFGLWSVSRYSDKSKSTIHLQRNNTIQTNCLFSEESLEHLEYLINLGAKEQEFQLFFQKYPQFITTLGSYAKIHPQMVLHEDDGKSKIPDFFIERFDSKFCDICEIKRPTLQLTKQTYNLSAFRDRINVAIQQALNYRDYFDDEYNRQKFYRTYGLKAYKPRIILIIGRTNNFIDDMERIKLEDRMYNDNIKLYTYDEISSNAKRWKNLIATAE